jgi:hypothetical protein
MYLGRPRFTSRSLSVPSGTLSSEESAMRYLVLVLVAAFIAFVGLAEAGPVRETAAQDAFATPGPGEFELVPGQIGRVLAGGLVAEPPTAPVELAVLRFTNDPGSVYAGSADDPSAGLILVESGEVTVRLEGPATITRATGPEEVAAGTEFTLGSGESFLWPPYVAGELRNDGQEPAVTLLAYLAPVEEEAATPGAGTPTP